VGHDNVQAVRSQIAPLLIVPDDPVGRRVELLAIFSIFSQFLLRQGGHKQVLVKVFVRIVGLALILAGGILGENGAVRVNVGQHHMKVSGHVAQVVRVAGFLIHGHHGIVHHGIVIPGGALRVLPLLTSVNAFRQILSGPPHQLLCKRTGI